MFACSEGMEVAKLLLEHGADVHARRKVIDVIVELFIEKLINSIGWYNTNALLLLYGPPGHCKDATVTWSCSGCCVRGTSSSYVSGEANMA